MMRRTACLLALTLFVLVGGCKTNPSTGRSQLLFVTADQTRQMGIDAKPELVSEYGGEYPSAPLRGYVDQVGHTLLAHIEPEYEQEPWEFILLNSEVINAFALPGGKVFITIGLLSRLSNEAELAGVLGHEIGHVTARHVDERISQSIAVEIGLGVLGAATDSQLALAGAQLFGNGYLLKFNRDQELEADRQGLKYMSRAYYDPIGMREVMEVLMEASAGSRQPELFSTHPHPESRIKQIDQLLKTTYADTQQNPAYGTYPERFQRDAEPYFPPAGDGAGAGLIPASYCLICQREHDVSYR